MKYTDSELFKILGVDKRIKIIKILKSRGTLCVGDIAEKFNVSPSAISQHLKILKHAGLLNSYRKGFFIHYSVNEKNLEKCNNMLSNTCSCNCVKIKIKPEKINNRIEYLKKYKELLESELKKVKEDIIKLEKK